jgi:hypothetical protein
VHPDHPVEADQLVVPQGGDHAVRLRPQHRRLLRHGRGLPLVRAQVGQHLPVHERRQRVGVARHEVQAAGVVRPQHLPPDRVVVPLPRLQVRGPLPRGAGRRDAGGGGGRLPRGLRRVGLERAVGVGVAGDDVVVGRLDDVPVDHHGGADALPAGAPGGGLRHGRPRLGLRWGRGGSDRAEEGRRGILVFLRLLLLLFLLLLPANVVVVARRHGGGSRDVGRDFSSQWLASHRRMSVAALLIRWCSHQSLIMMLLADSRRSSLFLGDLRELTSMHSLLMASISTVQYILVPT